MEFTIKEYNEEPQNHVNEFEQNKYQEPIENTEQNVFEEVLLCKPVTIAKKCEHGKRKTRCVECGGSEICEHKKRRSRCAECGGIEICEHKKNRIICIACGGSQICEHKKHKTSCIDCNGHRICEHKKIRIYCVECHGSALCDHKLIKSKCKDCNCNNSFCEHNKKRSVCIPCGGSQICEHKKHKSKCRDCDGSSFCEHKTRKSRCKICKGSEICEHNRIRSNCKGCKGSMICIHNRAKTVCRECGGSQICEHNRIKTACFDCKGGSICEHNKRRIYCVTCGGSQICIHKINKRLCKECDGSILCKTPFCETYKNPKKEYEGHCLRCFIHLHPDKPNSRNYKTKERTVVDIVLAAFPSFTWITDKKVIDGCSRRRPDLFLDMGSHVIIVEVDENQHTEYDCSCENKRLMEISQDIGHRPIIFIRFNPDDYTDQSGTKVKSCFAADKSGIFKVAKSKVGDWNMRTNALLQQIAYWSETPTTKTVEVVQLFYDADI